MCVYLYVESFLPGVSCLHPAPKCNFLPVWETIKSNYIHIYVSKVSFSSFKIWPADEQDFALRVLNAVRCLSGCFDVRKRER